MNLKQAFTFMFKDSRFWHNALIAMLMIFIGYAFSVAYYQSIGIDFCDFSTIMQYLKNPTPTGYNFDSSSLFYGLSNLYAFVLTILLFGYTFLLTRNCNNSTEKILPDWIYNIKAIIINGGKMFFSHFIFIITFEIAFCIIFLLYILTSCIFLIISKTLVLILLALGIVVGLLAFCLFLILFSPAQMLTYVDTEDIFAFFNLVKAWKIIKTDVKKYITTLLIAYGIIFVVSISAIVIFFIGLVLVFKFQHININILKICFYGSILFISLFSFYCQCIYAYLFGQVYKNYKLKTENQI